MASKDRRIDGFEHLLVLQYLVCVEHNGWLERLLRSDTGIIRSCSGLVYFYEIDGRLFRHSFKDLHPSVGRRSHTMTRMDDHTICFQSYSTSLCKGGSVICKAPPQPCAVPLYGR